MKTLDELVEKQNPAWNVIKTWFKSANNHYEILSSDIENAGKQLVGMQLSTATPLGSIIFYTGGLLIDHGWLRILGSGNERLARGFFDWNFGKTFEESGERPFHLLIADDVIGGYFAINGGGLGNEVGLVYYHHPKKLKWESIGLNYSQFLGWALNADLSSFYQELRWNNWQNDIKQIGSHQIIQLDTKVIQPIERHYQNIFAPENLAYSVN